MVFFLISFQFLGGSILQTEGGERDNMCICCLSCMVDNPPCPSCEITGIISKDRDNYNGLVM